MTMIMLLQALIRGGNCDDDDDEEDDDVDDDVADFPAVFFHICGFDICHETQIQISTS